MLLADYKIPESHTTFLEIAADINSIHQNKIKDISDPTQKEKIRSVEESLIILKVLSTFKKISDEFIRKNPSFLPVIEGDFLRLDKLENKKFIEDKILSHEHLFFKEDDFPVSVEGEFLSDLVPNYPEAFRNWIDEYLEIHQKNEVELKESFNEKQNLNNLKCQCHDCISLYRTRIAEVTKEKIAKRIAQLEDDIDNGIASDLKINKLSYLYQDAHKKIQNILKRSRQNLRKSSFNKISNDSKDSIKKKFFYEAGEKNTASFYVEKLKAFLFSDLEGIKPEFFSQEELDRFFTRLKYNIWRPASFIKNDFSRFTQTLLALKRKDVSSGILTTYLGQFWIHSKARRKNRNIIYHMGPTNSGKTYNAIEALAKARKGCYLAPLRLLAGEIYDTLNTKGVLTTLLTGEEVIETPGAQHYSSTIEMARLKDEFDCVVIDEIQMISDKQRGWAWTRALIHMDSEEIHLCGDASALELVEKILKLTGDNLSINQYERKTELIVEPRPVEMEELRSGDALIVFSRRNALKNKIELEKIGHKVSIIYGALNPDVRREQARRFDSGETSIIVSTDAISMGMNLPVKRIVFSTFVKFIASKEYHLSPSDIKQIAGRAGRFGRFPKGYVSYINNEKNEGGVDTLNSSLNATLDPKKSSMLGPDLDLYLSVNSALKDEGLITLKFSEFLRLFNEMDFREPFLCVKLTEMIEVAEMIEGIDDKYGNTMKPKEIFGFSCAPVSLRNPDHLQYFLSIVNRFANQSIIKNELIDSKSTSIDYLETAIKSVELYQWLARHFEMQYFEFDPLDLGGNKKLAVEQLNLLLSEKTIKYYNPRARFNRGGGGRARKKKKFNKKASYGKAKFSKSSKKNSRRRKPKK